MIINENLYSGDDIYVPPNNIKYQFLPVNFDINFNPGESYTLSCTVDVSIGNTCELKIFNGDYSEELFSKQFTAGKRDYLTFKFSDNAKYRFAFYAGNAGKTNNIKAYYKKVKIEKGDKMTIYLPHKSKVKAEYQAIFPIGGGTQKSIRHKAYKGVGLC